MKNRDIKVIPTMSVLPEDRYNDILNMYYQLGIDTIRINMTRYEPMRYAEEIKTIKELYGQISDKPLNIMLDIPIPGVKPRVFFDGQDEYALIKKGDRVTIVSSKDNVNIEKKCIFIDDYDFFTKINVNNELFSDDGKLCFIVKQKFEDLIILEATNSGNLGYLKAFYSKNYIFKEENRKEVISSFITAINYIKPQSIVLSFIENSKQVIEFKNMLF